VSSNIDFISKITSYPCKITSTFEKEVVFRREAIKSLKYTDSR